MKSLYPDASYCRWTGLDGEAHTRMMRDGVDVLVVESWLNKPHLFTLPVSLDNIRLAEREYDGWLLMRAENEAAAIERFAAAQEQYLDPLNLEQPRIERFKILSGN